MTAGANLTYTIAVRNEGPGTAESVVLRDGIPAGTTFVSFAASAAGWALATPPVGGTGEVRATRSSLSSGDSAEFTLVVQVGLTATGRIRNSGGITSATPDPDTTNNADTEFTTVGPSTPGCTITGTEGTDILNGTLGDDVICGLGGNDIINGRGGNDVIYGGPGRDLISGGKGDDMVYGEEGTDFIKIDDGVSGNDNADGGPGFDLCSTDPLDAVLSCPDPAPDDPELRPCPHGWSCGVSQQRQVRQQRRQDRRQRRQARQEAARARGRAGRRPVGPARGRRRSGTGRSRRAGGCGRRQRGGGGRRSRGEGGQQPHQLGPQPLVVRLLAYPAQPVPGLAEQRLGVAVRLLPQREFGPCQQLCRVPRGDAGVGALGVDELRDRPQRGARLSCPGPEDDPATESCGEQRGGEQHPAWAHAPASRGSGEAATATGRARGTRRPRGGGPEHGGCRLVVGVQADRVGQSGLLGDVQVAGGCERRLGEVCPPGGQHPGERVVGVGGPAEAKPVQQRVIPIQRAHATSSLRSSAASPNLLIRSLRSLMPPPRFARRRHRRTC
ncbi:hypothetical protein ACFQZ4_35660 [Catellatospora coxensis]